jgi:hypothetical protein
MRNEQDEQPVSRFRMDPVQRWRFAGDGGGGGRASLRDHERAGAREFS